MLSTVVTTVLAFAFVFAAFAVSHELGHFLVGRAAGIKTYEFAIGFGPVIARRRRAGTTYSLRAFPLGAFVKFAGLDRPDDPRDDIDAGDPRSFRNRPLPLRIATILAGPLMNFVTALLLFTVVFIAVGVPVTVVADVRPSTPAESAGFRAGDRIVAIGGARVETIAEAKDVISASPGKQLVVTVERDGQAVRLTVTPTIDPETNNGVIGVMLSEPWQRAGIARSVRTGVTYTIDVARSLVVSIWRMLTGRTRPEVAGPIGIAQVVGETARTGIVNLLYLAALLNVNLGLLNLLPVPVLDGGWIVLLAIEAVRRRPLGVEQEAFARMVGMAIIALLVAFATMSDIARLGGLIG